MAIEQDEFAGGTAEEKPRETNSIPLTDEDVPYDESFTYDGYQVVRGEFFAHTNEPTITFNNFKVSLNAACIKRLPDVEYVQILINSKDRKLIVRPSSEDEKESFVWGSKGIKRTPKQVTARDFFAKLLELTRWNPNYRYKILGKMFRSGDEFLFIFDLNGAQEFPKEITDEGKVKSSRKPLLPIEWRTTFGPTVEEHRKQMQAIVFKDYTVFSVQDRRKPDTHPTEKLTAPPERTERKEGS
ncbi:hypothetical protein FACS1894211_06800 [Clostridia bacterium]|nr:hypothetical protein FACS1894211_06800 [Clostridia bacterium]